MLELEEKTLKALFNHSVNSYGSENATSFVDETPLTYAEIGQHVSTISRALKKMGIQQGDKVAILSENSPRWGIAYFAITTMGAVVIPILADFHKSEVHHILKNSGSKILFLSTKLAHKIADAEIKDLKQVILLNDDQIDLEQFHVESFTKLISTTDENENDKKETLDVKIHEDDLAEILYTSGTTGHSKGVMLTHKNIVSNAIAAVSMIDMNETDRFVSILPLAHSYECTCGFISPFLKGGKIFYIKGLPTAQTLLPAVAKIKPTIILSVPLIMDKIYKKKVVSQINAKASSKMLYKIKPMRKLIHRIAGKKLYEAFGGELRFMIFGGAATPIEVEIFLTDGGFPYSSGYGLTESAPILTVNPVNKVKQKSCGITVQDVKIRIDDPDPKTGIGEIVATGPNIMKGYYRNKEATENTFTKDGWLKTGDKGYIDEEGYLFIKGRSKNIIVGPSGENIFPEEIEFHLSQNPYVLESLVYEKDSRIYARVFLDYDAVDKEFGTSDLDDSKASKIINDLMEGIRKSVNQDVASYSRIHKLIEQPEEFIKTPTKKIKRYLYTN